MSPLLLDALYLPGESSLSFCFHQRAAKRDQVFLQATDLIVDVYEGAGNSEIEIADFDAWTFFVLYIAQVLCQPLPL